MKLNNLKQKLIQKTGNFFKKFLSCINIYEHPYFALNICPEMTSDSQRAVKRTGHLLQKAVFIQGQE